MKICAICPTRKRLPRLLKMLDSLMATVSDKDCLEAVIRVDDDDHETILGFPKQNYPWVKMVIGARHNGYVSMGIFVTEACNATNADWCLLIDDDCWLVGKDWDKQVLNLPIGSCIAQAEFYHLGGSMYRYTKDSPVGLFFPNKIWERIGLKEIGEPADLVIFDIAINQLKWEMKFIDGLTYRHDRDSDEVMAKRD